MEIVARLVDNFVNFVPAPITVSNVRMDTWQKLVRELIVLLVILAVEHAQDLHLHALNVFIIIN